MNNPLRFTDEHSNHMPPKALMLFNFTALILALFCIVNAFYPLVSGLERNMLHGAVFVLLAVNYHPLLKKDGKSKSFVFDTVLGFLTAAAIIWFMLGEDAAATRQNAQQTLFSAVDWFFAACLLCGFLELTRRTTGLIIPILMLLSLSYMTWLGKLMGGVFSFKGLSFDTVLYRTLYGDDGLFGSIASIASTYVFLFIIFGAFLLRSGAGDFVVDLARGVAGRFIGGPGWVAVIASGLTGTISGSAVANTASTGVITIPLMKRAGFPAKFSAGVESAASTGGQIMPPIMGAGAFVMASYTLIPYEHIVKVSFLPALLYFFSVAVFVRIEAKKHNLQAVADTEVKPLKQALKDQGASFIIPIVLLIVLLGIGYTPTYTAVAGIVAIIVSSWFTKTKMGIRACMEALISGSRGMIMMGVLLIAVGVVINTIATTGIGNTFSLMINQWANGNLLIAIVLIAIASLVLGMGLPVTAAYIVLATLSAPALTAMMVDSEILHLIAAGNLPEAVKPLLMLADPSITEALNAPMPPEAARELYAKLPDALRYSLREQAVDKQFYEVALLSAHMIIFWLSQDSNVTPPVCLAAFTAATIAKTPPMATGFTSWKLAKGLYIMPILFAYTPFLAGDFSESLKIFAFACVGIYALAAAMQGGMERPLPWPWRLLCGLCGIALLWPHDAYRLIGLAAFALLFIAHFKLLKPAAPSADNGQDW